MNSDELDQVYTELCHAMTRAGDDRTALFLARFALLAMREIDDVESIRRIVDACGEGLDEAHPRAGAQAGKDLRA